MAYLPGMVLDSAHDGRYVCLGRFFSSNDVDPFLGLKTTVLDRGRLSTGISRKKALRTWYDLSGALSVSISSDPVVLPGGEGLTANLVRPARPRVILVSEGFQRVLDALIVDMDSRGAGSWPRGMILAAPIPVSPEGWPRELITGSDGLGLAILKVGRIANLAISRSWSQVGAEVTDLTALSS